VTTLNHPDGFLRFPPAPGLPGVCATGLAGTSSCIAVAVDDVDTDEAEADAGVRIDGVAGEDEDEDEESEEESVTRFGLGIAECGSGSAELKPRRPGGRRAQRADSSGG